jgi:hypothetical protein
MWEEAASIIYGCFEFRSPDDAEELVQFLMQIGPTNLRHLRRVRMRVCGSGSAHFAMEAIKVLDASSSLRCLTVDLGNPGRALEPIFERNPDYYHVSIRRFDEHYMAFFGAFGEARCAEVMRIALLVVEDNGEDEYGLKFLAQSPKRFWEHTSSVSTLLSGLRRWC